MLPPNPLSSGTLSSFKRHFRHSSEPSSSPASLWERRRWEWKRNTIRRPKQPATRPPRTHRQRTYRTLYSPLFPTNPPPERPRPPPRLTICEQRERRGVVHAFSPSSASALTGSAHASNTNQATYPRTSSRSYRTISPPPPRQRNQQGSSAPPYARPLLSPRPLC